MDMINKEFTNTLSSNGNLITLSEKENKKFLNKVEEAWFWYMFTFRNLQNELYRIEKEYNGFGIKLPNRCVELDDLFVNFIEIEVKKTKNKKYQKYLGQLLNCEEIMENKIIFGE